MLKFLDDLDDLTYREDLYFLLSNHGEIQWIDFIKRAKKKRGGGIILFHEKTEKALDKAENANNGNLQLRKKKKKKDGKFQEKDKTQH